MTSVLFRWLDEFCFKNSDVVWDLSSAISRARDINMKSRRKTLMKIIAPLTYSSKLLTIRPLNEIERWTIAFVGTLNELQGLQLLIEAMPEILRYLPNAMVRIIGDGPYAGELKRMVNESGLNEQFVFYGFVEKDSDVINIISRSAIGVAPYVPTPENNAIAADPGKTKLYAFRGLPVVTTKISSGLFIDSKGAGIAIDYDPHECAKAVIKLLHDDQTLEKYRYKAHIFAQSYTTERVFRDVFEKTLRSLQQNET